MESKSELLWLDLRAFKRGQGHSNEQRRSPFESIGKIYSNPQPHHTAFFNANINICWGRGCKMWRTHRKKEKKKGVKKKYEKDPNRPKILQKPATPPSHLPSVCLPKDIFWHAALWGKATQTETTLSPFPNVSLTAKQARHFFDHRWF